MSKSRYKHNYKHIKILLEDPIHQIYKDRWGIIQTKKYHQKLIIAIPSLKSHLRNSLSFTLNW